MVLLHSFLHKFCESRGICLECFSEELAWIVLWVSLSVLVCTLICSFLRQNRQHIASENNKDNINKKIKKNK